MFRRSAAPLGEGILMGLLDWFKGGDRKPVSLSATTEPPKVEATKNKLFPPEVVVATNPWAQNIVRYARKVSYGLQQAQVPTWLDEGYWVISADVLEATWHVPVKNQWTLRRGYMREGLCSGTALVLFMNGSVARTEFFGHFYFEEEGRSYTFLDANVDSWGHNTWGANNFGSWRLGTGGFGREAQATRQEGFNGMWNHKWADERPLGLGTSLALKRCSETHKTQLPRYYGNG
jgi:hypothetical protein